MALSDTKKAQTLINAAAQAAKTLDATAASLEGLRTLYTAAAVDPTGTALQGNVAAVSAWIDSVRAVADDPVVAGLIAAEVPSHRGEAL
jgi:hypothetical protein